MQSKEAIAKLVKLYTQEQSLAEEIKEVKDEAKSSGLDVAAISSVSKAIVTNKVDTLVAKSESILDTIKLSRE